MAWPFSPCRFPIGRPRQNCSAGRFFSREKIEARCSKTGRVGSGLGIIDRPPPGWTNCVVGPRGVTDWICRGERKREKKTESGVRFFFYTSLARVWFCRCQPFQSARVDVILKLRKMSISFYVAGILQLDSLCFTNLYRVWQINQIFLENYKI